MLDVHVLKVFVSFYSMNRCNIWCGVDAGLLFLT